MQIVAQQDTKHVGLPINVLSELIIIRRTQSGARLVLSRKAIKTIYAWHERK